MSESENGEQTEAPEAAEAQEGTTTEAVEAPAEEPKGLSLEDALEVAVEAEKSGKEPPVDAKPKQPRDRPATNDNRAAPKKAAYTVRRDPTGKFVEAKPEANPESKPNESALQPPAEWDKSGKDDFAKLPREQQAQVLRLYSSQKNTLSRISREGQEIARAKAEIEPYRQLATSIKPYLDARGINEPTEVALKKALDLWVTLNQGDPRANAANYLRARGIEPPKDLLGEAKQPDPQVTSLQREITELKNGISQQAASQKAQFLQSAYAAFESAKNGDGSLKYPDLHGEKGLENAAHLGSLVNGETPVSKQFIALTKARIPDLSYGRLLEEAYRYLGGRVAEQTETKTTPANHIQRSNRAAASVPGRSGAANGAKPAKRLSMEEALALAIAEDKERTAA